MRKMKKLFSYNILNEAWNFSKTLLASTAVNYDFNAFAGVFTDVDSA